MVKWSLPGEMMGKYGIGHFIQATYKDTIGTIIKFRYACIELIPNIVTVLLGVLNNKWVFILDFLLCSFMSGETMEHHQWILLCHIHGAHLSS